MSHDRSTIDSLITLMPPTDHTSDQAPVTATEPSTCNGSFAAASSVMTAATTVASTRHHDAYAKGQAALRVAIAAKGIDRRHWEHPIAPFLETMSFCTRFNPYSLNCPVQRSIVNPKPAAKATHTDTTTVANDGLTTAAMMSHDTAPTTRREPKCGVVIIIDEEATTTRADDGVVTLSPPEAMTPLSSVGSCPTSPDSSSLLGSGRRVEGKGCHVDASSLVTELQSCVVSVSSTPSDHMDDLMDTVSIQSDELQHPHPSLIGGGIDATVMSNRTAEPALSAACHFTPTTHHQHPTKASPTTAAAAVHLPVYRCLWYYRFPATFPQSILYGRRCAWALEHCTRRKLGGVCCDAHPLSIANMIYEACDIVPAGVDMFTNFKGRCSVWFHTEEEAQKVESALHQRVWMAPIEHGYALWADRADAQEMLALMRATMTARTRPNGAKHFAFPTHLLTVERWETR